MMKTTQNNSALAEKDIRGWYQLYIKTPKRFGLDCFDYKKFVNWFSQSSGEISTLYPELDVSWSCNDQTDTIVITAENEDRCKMLLSYFEEIENFIIRHFNRYYSKGSCDKTGG